MINSSDPNGTVVQCNILPGKRIGSGRAVRRSVGAVAKDVGGAVNRRV